MVNAQHLLTPHAHGFAGRRGVTVSLGEVFAAGMRFEAATFGLDARRALAELNVTGLPLVPIVGNGGLCREAHNAFRFKRPYVREGFGVPFLSSADIIGLRPERGKYINLDRVKKAEQLKIKAWDVLVSRSGTIGNVGLASPRLAGWALSEDAIRITSEDKDLAGYLAAFLRTTWGRAQLQGKTYGSVVQHIEPQHLTGIFIPRLPDLIIKQIGAAFVRAALNRDTANDLFDQADALLRARLQLPPLPATTRGPLVSTPRLSSWRGRFEASFHSPQALWLEGILHRLSLPIQQLGDKDVAEIRAVTKFRKRLYVPHGGIPLLSSKQLFQVAPVGVKYLARGAHEKDMDEISLQQNSLLVTCSGTIGRVLLVPSYMNGWASNQHSLRICPSHETMSGYLHTWLASEYGQALIQRYTYGSVIQEIDRFMLAQVPVPMLPETDRNDIAALALRANVCRDAAWRQEQEALRLLREFLQSKMRPVIRAKTFRAHHI